MDANEIYKIKSYIFKNDFVNAEQMIINYEQKINNDFDLLIVKTLLYIYKNDLETALDYAKQAVRTNRVNLEANLNMALVNELMGNLLESYKYYSLLFAMQENYKQEIVKKDDLSAVIDKMIEKMSAHLQELSGDEYQEYHDNMLSVNQVEMDLLSNMFVEMKDMDYYYGFHKLYHTDYYFARYDDWFHGYFRPDKCLNGNESKMEIVKIRKYDTEFTYDEEVPCIVPCVINTETRRNDLLVVNDEGEECNFCETIQKSVSYFKFDGWTRIKAEHPMVFGEPVLLKQDKNLKKLVFNIFIDSFNYKFIQDYPLEEVMPYTYRFFKDGIICNNAYVGSEFTYPSVSSYWTGQRPNRHKTLNQNLQFDIPGEFKLISEYFKEAGYFTSKIGGNCSVVPNYGYIKGVDRFVFEHYKEHFNVQQVVTEAIEHMETYQDTNQFIWFEIEDLHDVAGGWQRTPFVQTKAPYTAREVDNLGGSTLYQTFSPNKRETYKEELRHIDLYLSFIYQYINEHYKKEEVVVTLISDHGNGFNISNGQPFLSEQRMKVPFMFYCDWQGEHECNEIIESIDYMHIISKLSGVSLDSGDVKDGQLPHFFGGDRKKEYAVSQSIFPNKPYVASVFTEDQKFYLETVNKSGSDLRIDFSDLKYAIWDKEDNNIDDAAAVQRYLDILKNLISDFEIHK